MWRSENVVVKNFLKFFFLSNKSFLKVKDEERSILILTIFPSILLCVKYKFTKKSISVTV